MVLAMTASVAPAREPALLSAWDLRVLRFGRSANGRHWGRRAGAELVELLPLVPVRCVRRGGRLGHPPDDRVVPPVGIVASAWEDAHGVYALIALFDDAVHRALTALERDQLTQTVGASIVARILYRPQRDPDGVLAQVVTSVQEVIALDLVSWPSAEGAVLRSRKELVGATQ
jgi:hypothetical protein